MKTGIELIAAERQKQIDKYGFTGEHHADHPDWYQEGQLTYAAAHLLHPDPSDHPQYLPPNWELNWWQSMCRKPHYERKIIAGALVAAEIDRLNMIRARIIKEMYPSSTCKCGITHPLVAQFGKCGKCMELDEPDI